MFIVKLLIGRFTGIKSQAFKSILLQLLYCRSKHELDAVELVYLGCARVVVYGYDVAFRMATAQLLDYALAYDVVWQTGKRLGADNIRHAAMNQLNHFGG